MAHLQNLERDMMWTSKESAITYGAPVIFNTNGWAAGASTNVFQVHGFNRSNTIIGRTHDTPGQASGIGVRMTAHELENMPFRFKATQFGDAIGGFFGYGYETGFAGGQVTIAVPTIVATGWNCDEVLCIPPQLEIDTYYQSNLVFFAAQVFESTPGDNPSQMSVSVQRLAVKPDQYATAVA